MDTSRPGIDFNKLISDAYFTSSHVLEAGISFFTSILRSREHAFAKREWRRGERASAPVVNRNYPVRKVTPVEVAKPTGIAAPTQPTLQRGKPRYHRRYQHRAPAATANVHSALPERRDEVTDQPSARVLASTDPPAARPPPAFDTRVRTSTPRPATPPTAFTPPPDNDPTSDDHADVQKNTI